MRVFRLEDIAKSKLEKIKRRSFRKNNEVSDVVKNILSQIKRNGDKMIIQKYKKRIGKANFFIKVTNDEIKKAYKKVDKKFIKAVRQAIKNISLVHKAQLQRLKESPVRVNRGITVWRTWRAIEKVGLYIPGGKAIYPSSVLMTGIPAIIAGCGEIVVCSPPDQNGRLPAPLLVALDMIKIKNVFKVGGAEAIGAMAFGTKSIPRVYKIFGAGNSFVTEAKIQVFGTVSIDMPAGPSEIFIIADETAKPEYVAADLLADGEHGQDSACVLLTTSEELAYQVKEELEEQLVNLPTAQRARKALETYGLLAVVESISKAADFCNDYAPEHLEIMVKDAKELAQKINNAGSVFLGDWTTKSAGDYAIGANHVLPTGGMAKMFSPLSVESFGKMMQIQKVSSRNALGKIKNTIEIFSETEKLTAHKNATQIRFRIK